MLKFNQKFKQNKNLCINNLHFNNDTDKHVYKSLDVYNDIRCYRRYDLIEKQMQMYDEERYW